jgi:hypothetical protein
MRPMNLNKLVSPLYITNQMQENIKYDVIKSFFLKLSNFVL